MGLAFESNDDASRFGRLLQTKGFDVATPKYWSAEWLTTFCRKAGVEVVVSPAGTVPSPPSERDRESFDRLSDTSHERSPAQRSAHIAYGMWLESLLSLHPDDNIISFSSDSVTKSEKRLLAVLSLL